MTNTKDELTAEEVQIQQNEGTEAAHEHGLASMTSTPVATSAKNAEAAKMEEADEKP